MCVIVSYSSRKMLAVSHSTRGLLTMLMRNIYLCDFISTVSRLKQTAKVIIYVFRFIGSHMLWRSSGIRAYFGEEVWHVAPDIAQKHINALVARSMSPSICQTHKSCFAFPIRRNSMLCEGRDAISEEPEMLYDELNGCYGSRKHRPNTWNTHFSPTINKRRKISILCRIRNIFVDATLSRHRYVVWTNLKYECECRTWMIWHAYAAMIFNCNWNGWRAAHDWNNQIQFALKSICQFSLRSQMRPVPAFWVYGTECFFHHASINMVPCVLITRGTRLFRVVWSVFVDKCCDTFCVGKWAWRWS